MRNPYKGGHILPKRQEGKGYHRAAAFFLSIAILLNAIPAFAFTANDAEEEVCTCGQLLHTHTTSCSQEELVCGLEEQEMHLHTQEACYAEVLDCKLEELHTHTEDECYEKVFICEDPLHEHTDDECYESVLVCEKPEVFGHAHDESCLNHDPVCGLEEGVAHEHSDACYTKSLICGSEEIPSHAHDSGCYTSRLTCEDASEEHIHVSDCYDETLTCGQDETDGHQHEDDCYTIDLTCRLDDSSIHFHDETCYSADFICGMEEGEGHIHSESCYAEELTCKLAEQDIDHVHDDTCWLITNVCGLEEHQYIEGVCPAPKQARDVVIPPDKDTVTYEESGIDFNLYNYSGEMNLIGPYAENGKKLTTLSQYFNFNSGGTGAYNTGTKDVGNLGKGHLTYERNLGADGGPVIDWNTVGKLAALESTESRSIGYAFGTRDHFAVTSYEDITNTPLTYNPSTGYYEYDSAVNAVDFDAEENKVYVRGYKEQGKASADSNASFNEDDSLGDFFPFNSRIQTDEDGNITFVQDDENYMSGETYYHYDTSSSTPLAAPDYWFGASMHAKFYYPQDGYWMGSPMKYMFSGDDDVMLYIDGVYVMDLGGAHSRASGEIDFSTGLVETWLDAGNQTKLYPAGRPYDHKEWAAEACADGTLEYREDEGLYYSEDLPIRYYPTTIYDCYKAAYEEQGLSSAAVTEQLEAAFVKIEGETVEDAYGNEHDVYRFRDYSSHTLDWFYMERHGWEANFYTSFNLPTLPENSLVIEKAVEDSDDLIDDDTLYAFEVWATDEDGEASEKIDTIQLKAGESAVIEDMMEKTQEDDADEHFGFLVKELGQVVIVDGEETYSLENYATTWTSSEGTGVKDGAITDELSAETAQIVTFTNTVKAEEVVTPSVTKQVMREDTGEDSEQWSSFTTANYGDTVRYKLTGTMPSNLEEYETYSYALCDSAYGLTIDESSFEVTIDGQPVDASDYSLKVSQKGLMTSTFLEFSDIKAVMEKIGVTSSADTVVEATYAAQYYRQSSISTRALDVTGVIGSNSAWIQTTSLSRSNDSVTNVYSFNVIVDKVDEDGAALSGALFELEKLNEKTGEYEDYQAQTETSTSFTFDGLPAGSYRLLETTVPPGYAPMEPLNFSIVCGDTFDTDRTDCAIHYDETRSDIQIAFAFHESQGQGNITFTVANAEATYIPEGLPETGGLGTYALYVVGGILLIYGGLLILRRHKDD